MKIPKAFVLIAVVIIAGVAGAAATVAITAGATGSNVTYYACLTKDGGLNHVGVTSPTKCASTATVISWNAQGSTGAIGPQGPQGLAGAQGPVGPTGAAGPGQQSEVFNLPSDLTQPVTMALGQGSYSFTIPSSHSSSLAMAA